MCTSDLQCNTTAFDSALLPKLSKIQKRIRLDGIDAVVDLLQSNNLLLGTKDSLNVQTHLLPRTQADQY